jgi:hypothetical protein
MMERQARRCDWRISGNAELRLQQWDCPMSVTVKPKTELETSVKVTSCVDK